MSKAKTQPTPSLTPKQIAFGMMEIQDIAKSIERLALMDNFGLDDERDQEAVNYSIRTLANVSGLIAEMLTTQVSPESASWALSRGADAAQWLLPPAFHEGAAPDQLEGAGASTRAKSA